MAFQRHRVCPLLTTYGRVLILLQRHESLKRSDLASMLGLSENHVRRIVAELHSEGLIVSEALAGRKRWRLTEGVNVTERMANDLAKELE